MFRHLKKENEANGDVEVKDYRCSSTLWALGRSAKKHEFGPKSLVFDLKDEHRAISVKGRGKIMIDLSHTSPFPPLFVAQAGQLEM